MTKHEITRRSLIAGLGATALTAPLANTVHADEPAEATTAEQRRAFHLAEFKRACEELDPMIRNWTDLSPTGTCGGGTVSFRITGEYEGDGVYESGSPDALGRLGRWQVSLRPDDRIDGQRMFHVSCPGERMVLIESRLETFIGRRIA